MKEVQSESSSSGTSRGTQRGRASGAGVGSTQGYYENVETGSSSLSDSNFSSGSEGENESWSEGVATSRSYVPTNVPVLGKEKSHVQFRDLDEQLFRAMAVLFDQQQRQGVARLVGMNAPVSLHTPTVREVPGSKERAKRYLDKLYKKLPFALPSATAHKQIADRERDFADTLLKELNDGLTTAKRRVR